MKIVAVLFFLLFSSLCATDLKIDKKFKMLKKPQQHSDTVKLAPLSKVLLKLSKNRLLPSFIITDPMRQLWKQSICVSIHEDTSPYMNLKNMASTFHFKVEKKSGIYYLSAQEYLGIPEDQRVTMNFDDAPLNLVIQTILKPLHLSFNIHPAIQDRVTVNYHDVTASNALESLVFAHHLQVEKVGDILIFRPAMPHPEFFPKPKKTRFFSHNKSIKKTSPDRPMKKKEYTEKDPEGIGLSIMKVINNTLKSIVPEKDKVRPMKKIIRTPAKLPKASMKNMKLVFTVFKDSNQSVVYENLIHFGFEKAGIPVTSKISSSPNDKQNFQFVATAKMLPCNSSHSIDAFSIRFDADIYMDDKRLGTEQSLILMPGQSRSFKVDRDISFKISLQTK